MAKKKPAAEPIEPTPEVVPDTVAINTPKSKPLHRLLAELFGDPIIFGGVAFICFVLGGVVYSACNHRPAPIPQFAAYVFDQSGERLGPDRAGPIIGAAQVPAGSYRYIEYPPSGKPVEITVTIGGNAPTPPPKPNPPSPPQPPKPETGPRTVMIIRESKAKTPDQSATEVKLRTGEPAKYFAEKKHSLYVLDPDTKGGTAETWRKHYAGEKLPIVLICSGPADNLTVLAKAPLPSDTAGVIALLKANGG